MYPWYRDSVAAAAAAGLGGPVGVVGSGFCSSGPGQGATTIKTESGYSDCMLALDYVQSKLTAAPPSKFKANDTRKLEVAAITADKQLEIRSARAHLRGLSKGEEVSPLRSSAQRGKRRETRRVMRRAAAGGEVENNKKENASSNSGRRDVWEGKKRGKEERKVRSERARPKCCGGCDAASLSPSLSPSLFLSSLRPPPVSRSHTSAIPFVSLSPSPSVSLFLSLSLFLPLAVPLCSSCVVGDSVLQVVRPPIGGRGRRCAWVREAWCPPPIGYRGLSIPEVGRVGGGKRV
ncbi:hypothetical protein X777_05247 [Ooceraea biroi]|uniref:Uncharacterized protein n=1 Tax=Ooceraea biroi TaxID=2015173 RepID=A0A026WGK0_OOCBI|nr:hypothetical protein X777_05247 [Ooceraea biroi]